MDNSMIVVFGGVNYRYIATTELLDLTTSEGNFFWGPDLDVPLYGNAGVESVTKDYIGYSFGGYANGNRLRTIYGLRKSGNIFEWKEVPKKMDSARYFHTVVQAPTSVASNC